jgi:hypothetical protein
MNEEMKSIDRRSFLAGAGILAAAGVAGVVTGCSPDSDATSGIAGDDDTNGGAPGSSAQASGSAQAEGILTWLPEEPNISDADVEVEVEVDVVVVGLGVAGVAAARAASEKGASVVAFEKADGPQCRSGEYVVINGDLQARWGRNDMDPDVLADHEMEECAYYPKRAIWSKWAKGIADVFDWYIGAKEDLYICDQYIQDVPDEAAGAFLVPLYYPLPEAYDWTKEKYPQFPTSVGLLPDQGPVLRANMQKAVDENGTVPYYGHFVEKLIMDGARCVGCYVRNAETGKYLKATAKKV